MADRIVIKKNFKYRLYPTAAQVVALDGQLAKACRLYDAVDFTRALTRDSHIFLSVGIAVLNTHIKSAVTLCFFAHDFYIRNLYPRVTMPALENDVGVRICHVGSASRGSIFSNSR